MHPQTLRATFGGLLHDVGKLVYRAGADARDHATSGDALLRELFPGEGWRDMLDCVRYHHAKALRQAHIPRNSLAYIACVADNIRSEEHTSELQSPQ